MSSSKCITTRLIHPSINEDKLRGIIDKIRCLNQYSRKYIVLDDYSQQYLLLIYTHAKCREYLEDAFNQLGFTKTSHLVDILYQFKEYQGRIKELEQELKVKYDEKLYDDYQYMVSQRDKLLPVISMYWVDYKDLIDKLLDCINNVPLSLNEVLKDTIEKHEEYLEDDRIIKKSFLKTIGYIEPQISIIWVSTILPSMLKPEDLLNTSVKVKHLVNYLRYTGCSSICIVDGEEYIFIKRYLKLHDVEVV